MADPAVEKHWPHLVALIDTLNALDGRQVVVKTKEQRTAIDSDDADLALRVARELSKPGGPQIAKRAIANR